MILAGIHFSFTGIDILLVLLLAIVFYVGPLFQAAAVLTVTIVHLLPVTRDHNRLLKLVSYPSIGFGVGAIVTWLSVGDSLTRGGLGMWSLASNIGAAVLCIVGKAAYGSRYRRSRAATVLDVLEAWRSTRPDAITPDYDASLIIDLGRRTIRLEQGDLHPVAQAQLPDGYDWSLHRATPSGHSPLPDLLRLRSRAPKGKSNLCQEVIHLQGSLGLDAGMYFSIRWNAAGAGKGVVLLDTYPFTEAGADADGVNQSLLVEWNDADPRVQTAAPEEPRRRRAAVDRVT
ncbi:MAG: hypothetical protein ACYTFI_04085 [Planctomycetota bacterium]|jgi:hypothetical protein